MEELDSISYIFDIDEFDRIIYQSIFKRIPIGILDRFYRYLDFISKGYNLTRINYATITHNL